MYLKSAKGRLQVCIHIHIGNVRWWLRTWTLGIISQCIYASSLGCVPSLCIPFLIVKLKIIKTPFLESVLRLQGLQSTHQDYKDGTFLEAFRDCLYTCVEPGSLEVTTFCRKLSQTSVRCDRCFQSIPKHISALKQSSVVMDWDPKSEMSRDCKEPTPCQAEWGGNRSTGKVPTAIVRTRLSKQKHPRI